MVEVAEKPTLSEKESKLDRFIRSSQFLQEGLQVNQATIPQRIWRGQELADVVGVTQQAISSAKKQGRIPNFTDNPEKKGGAFLEDINEMQKVFKTSPRRKENDECVVLSFTNFKGGCWKSTTALHAGSYFSSIGMRVLLIDLDPQASMTLNLGYIPDLDVLENDTLSPFISEVEGFEENKVKSVVRDTHICNLKLIPSCLAMSHVDVELTSDITRASLNGDSDEYLNCFTRLRQLVENLKDDFDIIIMDGTPSLGLLPMNIVFASDEVIVPVPTEVTDFASTQTFCKLLLNEFGLAKRTCGDDFEMFFPGINILPTRYSSSITTTMTSETMLTKIRKVFGPDCLDSYIMKHDSVVGNLSLLRRTIFDVNPGIIKTSVGDIRISKQARLKAIVNFSEAFNEILDKLIIPRWNRTVQPIVALRG